MQPKRVLDVGIGNGRMGFLAREYGNKEGISRWRPGPQVVDGIEGYAPYIGPIQNAVYDRILIGDALDLLPDLAGEYELVIASDILEHFTHDVGLRFLSLAAAAGDVLLVSTPSFDMPQASDVNPLENHLSYWPATSLRQAGAKVVHPGELSTFALFGEHETIAAYVRSTTKGRRWEHRLARKVKRMMSGVM